MNVSQHDLRPSSLVCLARLRNLLSLVHFYRLLRATRSYLEFGVKILQPGPKSSSSSRPILQHCTTTSAPFHFPLKETSEYHSRLDLLSNTVFPFLQRTGVGLSRSSAKSPIVLHPWLPDCSLGDNHVAQTVVHCSQNPSRCDRGRRSYLRYLNYSTD